MRARLREALLLMTAGCGAPTNAAPAVEEAREPAVPALELRVLAPEPSDPRLVLELENRSTHTVTIPGARARVEVRRDGEPVRECTADRHAYSTLVEGNETFRPRDAHRFATELPCALDAPGDYALLVEVVVGASDDPIRSSPIEDHLAATARVRVEQETRT